MRNLVFIVLFLTNLKIVQAQTPTLAASNLAVVSTYCSQTTLSWTNGNGNGRIVVASKGAANAITPANNSYYLANDSFGIGHAFSANQFVVYNGTGTSVVIDNLETNTTYYFAVFEFNGGGSVFNFRTSSYPEINVTTKNLAVSFSINDPYQCQRGNSFNFTSSVTQTDASTAVTYNWDFGNGIKSTVANPTYSYPTHKIYNVGLKVSSFRCKAEFYKPDTVAPMPVVSFELFNDSLYNAATQCYTRPDGQNNQFWFKNKSSFGSLVGATWDYTFIMWRFGDGVTDNSWNSSHSYSIPGTYNVKLVAIGSKNNIEFCSDSFSLVMTVLPSPFDSSLLDYDSVKCIVGNVFDFNYNSTNSLFNYSWDFGDGTKSNVAKNVHSYASIGKYKMSLSITDDIGCTGSYVDSVRVIPQPVNVISGLAGNYCQSAIEYNLTTTLTGGQWLGDVNTATGKFIPSKLGLNTIGYAVNENGCKDTALVTATVNEVPVFEIGADTVICSGTSFTKRISPKGASVLWNTNNTDSFLSINTLGMYWAQLSKGACSFRDSFAVQMIGAPVVKLGGDSLLCGDGVKYINVTAPEATYTWSDGYAGGGVRQITKSGTYSVVVTNKCGTATDDINLTFLDYACQIFVPDAFSPNGDGLNDVFRASGNVEIIGLEVYNVWGEKLYEGKDGLFSWDGYSENQLAPVGHYYFFIRYLNPENGYEYPQSVSGGLYLTR